MISHGNGSANNDFVDLIRSLWIDRRVIGVIAISATLLTTLYALMLPKVYQSDVVLVAPSPQKVAEYNQMRRLAGLNVIKADTVFWIFATKLKSEQFRADFLKEAGNPASHDDKADFLHMAKQARVEPTISIITPDRQNPHRIMVSVRADIPELPSRLATRYVHGADRLTRMELVERLSAEVAIRIKGLERRRQVERQLALKRRQQRISDLQEALVLAKQAGFYNPAFGSPTTDSRIDPTSDTQRPLYMLGIRVLSAELAALQAGKSEDSFNGRLRKLDDELFVLNSIKVDEIRFDVFRIERTASNSDQAVKPKRLVTIVLGLVMGVIFGVLVGMIRFLYIRHVGEMQSGRSS